MKVPNGDIDKYIKQDIGDSSTSLRNIVSNAGSIMNNQIFCSNGQQSNVLNLQQQLLSNGLFSFPKPAVPCANQVPENFNQPNQHDQCPSTINELSNLMTLFPPSTSAKCVRNSKKDKTPKTEAENINLLHQSLMNQNIGSGQHMIPNQGMAINPNLINDATANPPLTTSYLPNQCLLGSTSNNNFTNTNALQINEQLKNFLNCLQQNQSSILTMQQPATVPVTTTSTLTGTTINQLLNSMPGPSNIPNVGTVPPIGLLPQLNIQQQPHLLHQLRIPLQNDSAQSSTIIQLSPTQQMQLVQQAVILSTNAPMPPAKEIVDDILKKRKLFKPKAKIEGCEPLDISTVAGYPVTCFVVAGEPRISFSEFSNTVLPHIAVSTIHDSYQKFNMSTKCATDKQLLTLKLEGRVPVELGSCTLITKSNAEKLAGHFLCDIRHMDSFTGKYDTSTFIKVIHNVFGGNTGLYYPHFPKTHCIQCIYCQFVFGPQRFLTHTHNGKCEKLSVWGFDARKWRTYYNPPIDEKIDDLYMDIFKTLILENTSEISRKRPAIDMNDDLAVKKSNNYTNCIKNETERRKENQSPFYPTPPGSEPSPPVGMVSRSGVTRIANNNTFVDLSQYQPNNLHVYTMSHSQTCKPNNSLILAHSTSDNNSAFIGPPPMTNSNFSQNNLFASNSSMMPQNVNLGNTNQNALNSIQFNILINQLLQSQSYIDDPNKSLIESLAILVPYNHLTSVLTKLNREFNNYKKEIDLLKEQNKRMEKIIQLCLSASDGKLSEIIKLDEITK
uniref:C-SKI_SMAD_bind domain-containing protein n=1 Tax=Parastrongyloides trichosuri TaxID=131310 RepID=A0A0N4Z389_PARTI